MTKSLSQLCNQVSFANIKIPRIDAFKDVFDFIAEFESLSSALDDAQRVKLIHRAFPPGCHRPWFETELAPLMSLATTTWSDIRRAIIKRFSTKGEGDRHIFKLRELTYDPDGGQSLLDFFEEMIFSLRKALKREDPAVYISLVKASIPEKMRPAMNLYPEFRNADTLEALKEAAKQYDLTKSATYGVTSSREATKELATLFRDMVKNIQKDNEDTRKAVVAAFQSIGRGRSDRNRSRESSSSPPPRRSMPTSEIQRYNNSSQGDYSRNEFSGERYKSNINRGQNIDYPTRGRSPQRYGRYPSSTDRQSPNRSSNPGVNNGPRYASVADRPPTPGNSSRKADDSKDQEEAFDTKRYYATFRRPPNPCEQCQGPHWNRHCPFYLN